MNKSLEYELLFDWHYKVYYVLRDERSVDLSVLVRVGEKLSFSNSIRFGLPIASETFFGNIVSNIITNDYSFIG